MVKIVKNPGNGRLNNLNDLVLNVLTTPVQNLHVQSVGHNHSMPSSQCSPLLSHQQNLNTLSRHLSAPPPRHALPQWFICYRRNLKFNHLTSHSFKPFRSTVSHRTSRVLLFVETGVLYNSMTHVPSFVRIGRFKRLNEVTHANTHTARWSQRLSDLLCTKKIR